MNKSFSFLIIGFVLCIWAGPVARGQTYFLYNTINYTTFNAMLAAMNTGGSATETENYDWVAADDGATITQTLSLDLNGKTTNNTNNYACTIGDGVTFALLNGTFDGNLSFAGTGSILCIISGTSGIVLGNDFSIISASPASGIIEIGDGSASSTFLINSSLVTRFNSKVSKIKIKNNSFLTITN